MDENSLTLYLVAFDIYGDIWKFGGYSHFWEFSYKNTQEFHFKELMEQSCVKRAPLYTL